MGIEVRGSAPLPKRGLLRRPVDRVTLFRQISAALPKLIDDDLMRDYAALSTEDRVLLLWLHPGSEPIEFGWEPGERVTVCAKTSSVGPGYHVFVVELLERIGARCRMTWNWEPAPNDLPTLQREYGCFLGNMARRLIELSEAGATDLLVNWPLDTPHPVDAGFCVAPTGVMGRSWWEQVASATPDELMTWASTFAIWWDARRDAHYYDRLGRVLLWSEVPWRPPVDERERTRCSLAIAALERAGHADGNIRLPQAEIEELRRILQTPAEDYPIPAPEGIGYARRAMRHATTGGWTIALPGYFYSELSDDGSQIVFWYDNRTVQVSSISVGGIGGRPAAPTDLLPDKAESDLRDAEVIDHATEHLSGWATIRPGAPDTAAYLLQGWMAGENTMTIISIQFDDAKHRPWAMETFASLLHPPNAGQSSTLR